VGAKAAVVVVAVIIIIIITIVTAAVAMIVGRRASLIIAIPSNFRPEEVFLGNVHFSIH
jgi:hypothetical protein